MTDKVVEFGMNVSFFAGSSHSAIDVGSTLKLLLDFSEGMVEYLRMELLSMEEGLRPVIEGKIKDPNGNVVRSLATYRLLTKAQPIHLLQFLITVVPAAAQTMSNEAEKIALLLRITVPAIRFPCV